MSDAITPTRPATSLPDPYNQVEVNRWMIDHITALERERDERRINASAAARSMGYSGGYFRGRPWRVPYFGAKGMLWSLREWRVWNETPEALRRREWDAMPVKERAVIRGVA